MTLSRGGIRGISFDYGHVLGGLDLRELASRLGSDDVAALRDALPTAYRAADRVTAAGLGHEAAWRALMITLVSTVQSAAVETTVDALWAAQPTRNLWRDVPPAARALLAELSAASVPMTITSNSEGRVRELLVDVGILQHFTTVLDSGLLGFAKPDRRIFERAASALALPMDQIVHVGDSEAADIEGARAAGMRTIRFDGFVPGIATHPTCADARVTTFDELRAVLLVGLGR